MQKMQGPLYLGAGAEALRRCFCPECGEQLTGTNYLLKSWPTRELGPIKPLGKTHITLHKNTGQASLYCLEKNQYRCCRWEQNQKKPLTEEGKDDKIK